MERILLVFDLDGTLVDSVPDLRAAVNEMLRERGRPPLSPSAVKRMVGDGAMALVAGALAASGADPAGVGDARAAGVPLVLRRYGYARVAPEVLAADALLDHFADLPAALERLGLIP